jgi:hypothetical protein
MKISKPSLLCKLRSRNPSQEGAVPDFKMVRRECRIKVLTGHGRGFLQERESQEPKSSKVALTIGVPTITYGAYINHLNANSRKRVKLLQRRSQEVVSQKE